MTRLLLPKMIAKKTGCIVNISSAIGKIPGPLMTAYASTKAYVNNFSDNMHLELCSKGITVQTHSPMWVVTDMTKHIIKRPTVCVPTAEAYAKAAVPKIGYPGNISPYWRHAWLYYLFQHVLPYWLQAKLVLRGNTKRNKMILQKRRNMEKTKKEKEAL